MLLIDNDTIDRPMYGLQNKRLEQFGNVADNTDWPVVNDICKRFGIGTLIRFNLFNKAYITFLRKVLIPRAKQSKSGVSRADIM